MNTSRPVTTRMTRIEQVREKSERQTHKRERTRACSRIRLPTYQLLQLLLLDCTAQTSHMYTILPLPSLRTHPTLLSLSLRYASQTLLSSCHPFICLSHDPTKPLAALSQSRSLSISISKYLNTNQPSTINPHTIVAYPPRTRCQSANDLATPEE